MPKGLPAASATEPFSIVVAEARGIVLRVETTIDPLTKKHQVKCDFCNKKVRLTKSAHPHGLFEDQKFCIIREGRGSDNQRTSPIFRVSNPVQPHVGAAVPIGSGSGRTVYQEHIHYQELLYIMPVRANLVKSFNSCVLKW
jgi:hypothetical protein